MKALAQMILCAFLLTPHARGPHTKCALRLSLSVELSEDYEFFIPYHFHPLGEEFMTVSRGFADFTIEGRTTRLTPEMGALRIPANHRHSIRKPKGVASVVHEHTSINSEQKAQFFKELFTLGDKVMHLLVY